MRWERLNREIRRVSLSLSAARPRPVRPGWGWATLRKGGGQAARGQAAAASCLGQRWAAHDVTSAGVALSTLAEDEAFVEWGLCREALTRGGLTPFPVPGILPRTLPLFLSILASKPNIPVACQANAVTQIAPSGAKQAQPARSIFGWANRIEEPGDGKTTFGRLLP